MQAIGPFGYAMELPGMQCALQRGHLQLRSGWRHMVLSTMQSNNKYLNRELLHGVKAPGLAVHVETYNSLFARRKYSWGHVVAEQWIMGECNIQTKHRFLVPVPRKDTGILLPIIIDLVQPRSIVWSDEWAAHNQLGQQGFEHGTVNHMLHFVDPATGVTTNRVEAMWQRAKAKFGAMYGLTNQEMVPDYLAELMWMQKCVGHAFYYFWHQIATDPHVV